MRRLITCLAGTVILGGLAACGRDSAPTIPVPGNLPVAAQYAFRDGGDSLVGRFTIDLDPETLEATVTPHRTATAQPPQGQRYDLDIANFQNADSLRITGVQVLGSGNFRVSFSHAHPFAAPDISKAASGTNRADLGYTGRLLFLTQYNPQAFFDGSTVLSAGAIANPDGYVDPRDLLLNDGTSLVTAYPYKLLVDEKLDNRDVSNGGNPEGSWLAAPGGWQRFNLGPDGTGWTGFDFLHGGQTANSQFDISRAALESGGFSLDVALLIQYTDPRGAPTIANRLPTTDTDVLDFTYRLPYAALDASKVTTASNIYLDPIIDATAPVTVAVRDWDASATEAADSRVGDETDVSLVQAGGSGAPEVVLDAPAILLGLRNMGTPTGSGASSDPLRYTNDLVNQTGAGLGQYWGCLQVIDPENADTGRADYHAGVDATTLIPSKSRGMRGWTWQIVSIVVGSDRPIVTDVEPTGLIGALDDFVQFSAETQIPATGWAWDFGEGTLPNTSDEAQPTVQLGPQSGVFTGTVTASNGVGAGEARTFTYRVLPPQAPGWSFHIAEPGSASTSWRTSELLIFRGRPIILYVEAKENFPLKVARALIANPKNSADWDVYIIDDQKVDAKSISLCEFQGRVAASYYQDTGEKYNLFRTAVDEPTEGDWYASNIRVGADIGVFSSLLEWEGRLTTIFHDQGAKALYYGKAKNDDPEDPSDWSFHIIEGTVLDMGTWLQVRPFAAAPGGPTNRLAVVYSNNDTDELRFAYSLTNQPISGLDWNKADVLLTPFDIFYPDLEVVHSPEGDRFAVAGYDLANTRVRIWLSSDRSPDSWSEWTLAFEEESVPELGRLSLTTLNDRLALTHYHRPLGGRGQLKVVRALQVVPGRDDWEIRTVLDQPGAVYVHPDILGYDNALHISAFAPSNGDLLYGRALGPW